MLKLFLNTNLNIFQLDDFINGIDILDNHKLCKKWLKDTSIYKEYKLILEIN